MRECSHKYVTLVVAVTLAICAFFLISGSSKVEEPPTPTPERTLAALKQLGAKWKLNDHGQVNWLFLKRLPLADDDLAILQQLPEVQSLNMRGIQTIKGNHFTNAGLRHLISLKKLRDLNLSANYHLADECSDTLKQLSSLKSLNISRTSITSAALPNISQLRNLEILYVKDFPFNEETISYFEQMPLRELWGAKFTDSSYSLLSRLRHLKKLPVGKYTKIKDTNLVYLQHISKIDQLSVSLTKGWTDTSQLKHLLGLPELENLIIVEKRIPEGPIDSSGINDLANISSLQEVVFWGIDDRILEAFSHCSQITRLNLSGTENHVTQRGFHYLTNMTSLKSILLKQNFVCDNTCAILGQIPTLERIVVKRQIPKNGMKHFKKPPAGVPLFAMNSLKHLRRLPNLKELNLDYLNINDEALTHIGSLKTLESLSIVNANISNVGLLQLRNLSNLKHLCFYGSKIDSDYAYKLHRFIPQCTIADIWCCGCLAIQPVDSQR